MASYQPHPGSPWVAEAVARVMAFDRTAVPIKPLPAPSGSTTWADVLDAMAMHRVVEVVFPHAKALGMDGDSVAVMYGMRHQLVAAGLKLELDTNAVSGLLQSADIDHLMVKGVALAALMGLAPSGRGAGDVDVWVRPADVERTEQVLHANGWGRQNPTLPEPADGWRWRLMLSVGNELPQVGAGVSHVDLHWRVTPWPGEHIPNFDTAYARSVQVPPLDDSVRTMCPSDALRHVAQHARKDAWPTLRHVVDVVRMADVCDPAEVVAMTRTEPNIALAMAVAGHVTTMDIPGWECDGRTHRLADEAWRGCLGLRNSLAQRNTATGTEAVAVRARYEWWLARSSPNWTTRSSWAIKLAVPLQKLVAPKNGPDSQPEPSSEAASAGR
jgi:hypothetical protein